MKITKKSGIHKLSRSISGTDVRHFSLHNKPVCIATFRAVVSMENTSRARKKPSSRSTITGGGGGNRYGGGEKGEERDQEAWETLSKSFRDVQTVLDQNRNLIQQVNENHQSKVPDNIAKNVGLIREINGNISKVVGLYSDLSVNFTGIVHQRRPGSNNDKAAGRSSES